MANNDKKMCGNPGCEGNHIPPLLATRKQAATVLGISVRTVDYLLASGQLRPRRIGGRCLVKYTELIRFSELNDSPPIVPPRKEMALYP